MKIRRSFMSVLVVVIALVVILAVVDLPYGKLSWKALAQYNYGAPTVAQCANNTVLSSPFPQSASGEFLLTNCFNITNEGTVNISLTQVLTNASSESSESDINAIRANPALLSWWRMGSWFLVPSTYNAATQTYSFQSAAGSNIYGAFYGGITRPAGTQGTSAFAGTTTGNVDKVVEDIFTTETDYSPYAAIFASAIVIFIGAIYISRQRETALA